MDDSTKKLIADWHRRSRQSQRVQYDTGNHYSRLNSLIGGTTIALSAVVSTGIFATLAADPALWIRIATGVLSLCSVVLSSLQTFLRFEQRADRYRADSARYGAIRRELEQIMAIPPGRDSDLRDALGAIKKQMDDLAQGSLTIPARVKRRAVRDLSAKPRQNVLFTPFDERRAAESDALALDTGPKEVGAGSN
ncbi:SLATT domain-containing protein [Micromonospora sp. NPDC005197]|uniref:SLATT domain-containing protein n=1 Tax=unclassified Micromonospora TaxID=2617518 RepID=UPI0033A181C8